uniref:Uncharacterized protein n=1 Tax=Triticum urartu TaxID=4572 RepID=A0A8R7V6N8_TRIUA
PHSRVASPPLPLSNPNPALARSLPRRLRSPSRPLLLHAPLVRHRRRLRSPSRSLLLHATSHPSPTSLLPPPFPPHSSHVPRCCTTPSPTFKGSLDLIWRKKKWAQEEENKKASPTSPFTKYL